MPVYFISLLFTVTVHNHRCMAVYKPKTWGNVAIVIKHTVSACFTKFLKVAVQYYALNFTFAHSLVLLQSWYLWKEVFFHIYDVFRLFAFAWMCIIDDSVIFFIMHIQVPGCLCVFLLLFWGRFNEEIHLHDWHFFVFRYHFWSNKHCVSVKPSFSEIPTCSVKFMN